MKNKSNFKNELEMTFALQQMEKTAPEIVRFQGLCLWLPKKMHPQIHCSAMDSGF